eukprot:PhF_6_TR21657/c3_g1_i1/m.30858
MATTSSPPSLFIVHTLPGIPDNGPLSLSPDGCAVLLLIKIYLRAEVKVIASTSPIPLVIAPDGMSLHGLENFLQWMTTSSSSSSPPSNAASDETTSSLYQFYLTHSLEVFRALLLSMLFDEQPHGDGNYASLVKRVVGENTSWWSRIRQPLSSGRAAASRVLAKYKASNPNVKPYHGTYEFLSDIQNVLVQQSGKYATKGVWLAGPPSTTPHYVDVVVAGYLMVAIMTPWNGIHPFLPKEEDVLKGYLARVLASSGSSNHDVLGWGSTLWKPLPSFDATGRTTTIVGAVILSIIYFGVVNFDLLDATYAPQEEQGGGGDVQQQPQQQATNV